MPYNAGMSQFNFSSRIINPLGTLLDKTFAPGSHIIGSGLMSRESIMVIGGPPKSYKSFLVNTMLYHLATGTPVFGAMRNGRPVFPVSEPQRCLLLEQEIGDEDLQERFRGMVSAMSPSERTLCRERISTYSCDPDMRLDNYFGVELISHLCSQAKPTVVAFDPLIEFHQQDENDASSMAKVIHGLRELKSRWHFAPIVPHHTSKPQKDSPKDGPHQLRGSSVIYGAGDSFLTLSVDGQRNLTVSFKVRRAKPIEDLVLRLNESNLRFEFSHWQSEPRETRDSKGNLLEFRSGMTADGIETI